MNVDEYIEMQREEYHIKKNAKKDKRESWEASNFLFDIENEDEKYIDVD